MSLNKGWCLMNVFICLTYLLLINIIIGQAKTCHGLIDSIIKKRHTWIRLVAQIIWWFGAAFYYCNIIRTFGINSKRHLQIRSGTGIATPTKTCGITSRDTKINQLHISSSLTWNTSVLFKGLCIASVIYSCSCYSCSNTFTLTIRSVFLLLHLHSVRWLMRWCLTSKVASCCLL